MILGPVAVFGLLMALVVGQAFYQQGECPKGKHHGDVWHNGCLECMCDDGGYGCTGCGILMPVENCTRVVNTAAPYPDCCPKLECPQMMVG